jgi:hypothetical protein
MKYLLIFLLSIINISIAFGSESFIVEFKNEPTKSVLQKIKGYNGILKVERFDDYESNYFNRLYSSRYWYYRNTNTLLINKTNIY